MNTKLTVTIIAAMIAACFSQTANAQGLVAVLDVAKVFEVNVSFKQQMDEIKERADSLKGQIQNEQTSIQQAAQAVLEKEVGEERYQEESVIEQRQAALRTKARQLETDLLKQEARIYHQTYEEMKSVVAKLAGEYGISLVMRFDSSPINSSERVEVIKGVNRTVVYHDHLDLTSKVIDAMGGGATSTAGVGTNLK